MHSHPILPLHTPHSGRWAVSVAVLCLASRVGIADELLVDPTRPATAASIAVAVSHAGQVRVEAILDRDGRRFALVDGRVVHAGDDLSWGHVEEVTATGIRYVAAGRIQFATLNVTSLHVRRAAASLEAAP